MLESVALLPALIVGACVVALYALHRIEPGSGTRLAQRQAAPPLAYALPYWHITADGVVIGTDLTYSAGIALGGVDTDCLTDADLDQIDRSLHAMLRVLPAGARLQWQHCIDRDHADTLSAYHAQARGDASVAAALVDAKCLAVERSSRLRRSRLHLFCSLPPERPNIARTGLARRFPEITQDQHDDREAAALAMRRELIDALRSAGIDSAPLDRDEIRQLAYEMLNPARCRHVRAPDTGALPYTEEQTLREQLCFSGLVERARDLSLDGHRVRVLTLRSMPLTTDSALFEALTVGLPFPVRVQVGVEILDDQAALDSLRRTRNQAEALATVSARRNQEAEAQYNEVAELIDENLYADIRMVRVTASIVLSVPETADAVVDSSATERASAASDADAALAAQTTEVLRALSAMHGAEGMVEDFAQLDAWLATLPANLGHARRWHRCTSANAAHMLLAFASWPGHPRPRVLLESGRCGVIGLDPFAAELDNPNAFMAGASGAGKSVTANYLLMHLLASGTKALIIDVGGSYIKLIELFGGDYISFEPEADPALNLFYDPADVRRPDSSLDPLRLQFMLTAIETLLVDRDRDSLSNAERAVLTGAVMQLYKDGYIEDGGAPTLRDLAGALTALHTSDDDDLATGRALARGLRHWLTGPHARLLDRRSNIKLTTDIAAFDLKGLPDEVRTPVVLILSAMIWNLVTRDTSERKVVVFDEVWTLLSSPASSRLIAELYRTSRKYGCSILSISQSVEDFTTSDIAGALVNNSATAYLLRHRVGHEIVADTFRLNERQQHVFRALEMRRGQYSELLVLSGDRSFVGRVVLTPLEYWIATTHPDDRAALDTMAVRHPDMALLDLLHACADRWPRGVATLDPDAARESLESLTAPRSTDGPQTAVHTHGARAA